MRHRRLALLVPVMAFLLATAPTTIAAPALPECRYADVTTRFRAYDRWNVTFLDTIYKVGRTYDPPNLRWADTDAGVPGHKQVRALVLSDLRAMYQAAKAANARFVVVSGYRSYEAQESVFAAEVQRYGYQKALTQSARPGHSEHQLGTTLDFRSYGNSTMPWDYADWGTTAAGKWLAANAWRYGFVMSYPKGKMGVTCYTYEPWHYRYVGRTKAAKVRQSGLTLREYLWRTSESIS